MKEIYLSSEMKNNLRGRLFADTDVLEGEGWYAPRFHLWEPLDYKGDEHIEQDLKEIYNEKT